MHPARAAQAKANFVIGILRDPSTVTSSVAGSHLILGNMNE
jgi:hypothetical protein